MSNLRCSTTLSALLRGQLTQFGYWMTQFGARAFLLALPW